MRALVFLSLSEVTIFGRAFVRLFAVTCRWTDGVERYRIAMHHRCPAQSTPTTCLPAYRYYQFIQQDCTVVSVSKFGGEPDWSLLPAKEKIGRNSSSSDDNSYSSCLAGACPVVCVWLAIERDCRDGVDALTLLLVCLYVRCTDDGDCIAPGLATSDGPPSPPPTTEKSPQRSTKKGKGNTATVVYEVGE